MAPGGNEKMYLVRRDSGRDSQLCLFVNLLSHFPDDIIWLHIVFGAVRRDTVIGPSALHHFPPHSSWRDSYLLEISLIAPRYQHIRIVPLEYIHHAFRHLSVTREDVGYEDEGRAELERDEAGHAGPYPELAGLV
jgi:hypothetical protein